MQYTICKDLESIKSLDFVPTVIIGFYQVGSEVQFQESFSHLKSLFPSCDVFGCSSQSNIDDCVPHIDKNSMVSCLYICINMPQIAYKIQLYTDKSQKIYSQKSKKYSAMVFSAKYHASLETLIIKLQEALGEKAFFGAISGIDLQSLEGSTLFYNGAFIDKGELIWYIDQEYYLLEGVSIHNFDPIGYELTITSAKKNIIYEIDHRPALDVLEEIIGNLSHESIASFDHPLFIHSVEGTNKDNKTLFSMKAIDRKRQSIHLFRNVFAEDKLKLAIPHRREAQERQLQGFKEYSQKDGLAFLFVCIAFMGNWGEMEPIYLMRLAKKMGMPFVGFHALGEIGVLENDSHSQLQNQTLTLAVLSERKA